MELKRTPAARAPRRADGHHRHGHKLARILYAMLSRTQGYDPQQLQHQQQRLVCNLKKRAQTFGFQLVPAALPSS